MKQSEQLSKQIEILQKQQKAAELREQAAELIAQAEKLENEAKKIAQASGQANPKKDIAAESVIQHTEQSAHVLAFENAQKRELKRQKNARQAANKALRIQLAAFIAKPGLISQARLEQAMTRCESLNCASDDFQKAKKAIADVKAAYELKRQQRAQQAEERRKKESAERRKQSAKRRSDKRSAKVVEKEQLETQLKAARKAESEAKANLKTAEKAHKGLIGLKAELVEAEKDVKSAKAEYKKHKPVRAKAPKKGKKSKDDKKEQKGKSTVTSSSSSVFENRLKDALAKVSELQKAIADTKRKDKGISALAVEVVKASKTREDLEFKLFRVKSNIQDLADHKNPIFG